MKKPLLLLVVVLFLTKLGYSGNHYTYALTSGNPVISTTSVTAGLQHGDTLDIPANAVYTSFAVSNLNGIAGDSIVIRFLPGSRITNTISYAVGEWTNASFIKVIGLNSQNNGSTVVAFRAGCHSIRFTQCNFSNAAGSYSLQPAVEVDDKYGSSMYFTGAKSQTFYDIRIDQSSFNGFLDVMAITAGTDITRSVCLDMEIDHNSFRNITQDGKIVPNALSVTGYNFKIHDNVFDSLAYNAGACQCTHNSWITIYGNGDVYNNKFSHTYGQDLRIVPMKFSGLPGYTGSINIFNNISTWHASYSFLETSPNNGYGRASGNGGYLSFTDTRIYFNTVYRTNRSSNNGDYAGMVADVYAQMGTNTPVYNSKVFVHNNVIIDPEQDRTYDPATRGYVIYFGSGAPSLDSGGNKVYQTLAQAGIADTVKWVPGNSSALVKAADASNPSVGTDIYGIVRSTAKAVGAAEAQGVTVPTPPANQAPVANAGADTAITLPANTVVLNGSKSKDADGTIAAYAWTMVSGPTTVTITNANTASASVGSLIQGSYSFRLQVTDNAGAIAADTVIVKVNAAVVQTPANQAPVANAGADTTITLPVNTVVLSGSKSKDADGTIATYAWTMVSGPSTATITNANTVTASIGSLIQGSYSFRLQVTDNAGAIAVDTVIVKVNAAVVQTPTPPAGTGTGLRGDYYKTNNLSGAIALTRTDATVNFDWVNGSPAAGISADNFSARWSGQVQAVYSETYTFYTSSDDGVRVWVNGQKLIDNWTNHSVIENSGTITLAAGQKYSIVMEYYEKTGQAVAKLLWSSASTPKAIIPQSRLYPAAVSKTTIATAIAGVSIVDSKADITASAGLAPNPVTAGQYTRLSFNSEKGGPVAIQVIDFNGRTVSVQQVNANAGSNTINIPTTGFTRGMYVVRVVEAGNATSLKLLVQ